MSEELKPCLLSDDIRVPLHELQADMDYLFGRVAADSSVAVAMSSSVKAKLSAIENALKNLAPEQTPAEAFGAALSALPALALAADCYVAIKVYASKAACDKAEGRNPAAPGYDTPASCDYCFGSGRRMSGGTCPDCAGTGLHSA